MVLMERECAPHVCDHKLGGLRRVEFIPLTVPGQKVSSQLVGRLLPKTLCCFFLLNAARFDRDLRKSLLLLLWYLQLNPELMRP